MIDQSTPSIIGRRREVPPPLNLVLSKPTCPPAPPPTESPMQSGVGRHLWERTDSLSKVPFCAPFPYTTTARVNPPISHPSSPPSPRPTAVWPPRPRGASTEYFGAPVPLVGSFWAGEEEKKKTVAWGSFYQNEPTSCTPRHAQTPRGSPGCRGFRVFARARVHASRLVGAAVEGRASADPCRHRPMASGSFIAAAAPLLLR